MMIVLLIAVVCSLTMYWLRIKCKLTDVQASAWLVLTMGVLTRVLDLSFACGAIAASVSYALMSDERVLGSLWEYAAAASITVLIFMFCEEALIGIGGRLGTFAFMAVLGWLGLKQVVGFLFKTMHS